MGYIRSIPGIAITLVAVSAAVTAAATAQASVRHPQSQNSHGSCSLHWFGLNNPMNSERCLFYFYPPPM